MERDRLSEDITTMGPRSDVLLHLSDDHYGKHDAGLAGTRVGLGCGTRG
jgi:hypothetical protein